ncbi:hypothetical protein AB1Y20_007303 [Prymnesium parvum]|uniref:Exostosin GT47 domain-containing protein n=1 Tax=Prymnesium parvum TaxID=97485 RepID=A0AB34IV23_PRYPA
MPPPLPPSPPAAPRTLLPDGGPSGLCDCLQRPQPLWNLTVASTRRREWRAPEYAALLAEMRASARVYVHPLPPGLGSNLTRRLGGDHAYMVEPAFFHRLASSPLLTRDAAAATLFVVPVFPASCRYTRVDPRLKKLRPVAACARDVAAVVGHVAASAAFRRRAAADHLWISAHDAGHDYALLADARFRAHAVAAANAADVAPRMPSALRNGTVPPFVPARDIALVPRVSPSPSGAVVAAAARRTLAFFAGSVRAGVRAALARGAAAFNAAAPREARRVRLVDSHLSAEEYRRALDDAVFCFCPRGHAVHSARLVEAILHGCIPAVLADDYWLPLSCFFDWRAFAVVLPEARAADAPALLAAIPPAAAAAMQAELLRVRSSFVFRPSNGGGADAFDLLLLEAHLRTSRCASIRPPRPPCGAALLLLLRGEAFRAGGHRSRAYAAGGEQMLALAAVRRHVAAAAAAAGWRVRLALDVVAPRALVRALLDEAAALRLDVGAWRAADAPPFGSQLASFAESLRWAAAAAGAADALLVCRADLLFKRPLPLPRPCELDELIVVPFQISDAFGSRLQSGHPRVADAFVFVPAARVAELTAAVRRAASASLETTLHDLCAWLTGVTFFNATHGFDSDSEKEWNPLYRIIGRAEAPVHGLNHSFLPRRRPRVGPKAIGC